MEFTFFCPLQVSPPPHSKECSYGFLFHTSFQKKYILVFGSRMKFIYHNATFPPLSMSSIPRDERVIQLPQPYPTRTLLRQLLWKAMEVPHSFHTGSSPPFSSLGQINICHMATTINVYLQRRKDKIAGF